MDRIRKGCLTLPRSKNVAVDQLMIPFTEFCAVKQYVPGETNPEGLKNFVLAAPKGLFLDFEVYQGRNTLHTCEDGKNLGVGGAAVLRLAVTLDYKRYIFFDRYFTSISLLDELKKR